MDSFDEALRSLYKTTRGSREVCIAMLDTDIDLDVPELRDAAIRKVSQEGFKATVQKTHGTHVARIIFASGAAGIAPQCRGISIPVYEDVLSGLSCSQERLANAILLAAANGAHIINISGGMLSPSDSSSLQLQAAVEYCHEKRIQIVAAVGNEGCECLHVPASLKHVLAVGATDEQGDPYLFNNYGWAYQKQGILVPLREMEIPTADGLSIKKAASSYAAPVVSAILGILAAVQLHHKAVIDPVTIKEILLETSNPCPLEDSQECKRYLAGVINLQAATERLLQELGQTAFAVTEVIPSAIPYKDTAENNEGISFQETVPEEYEASESVIVPSSFPEQQSGLVYALGTIGYEIPSQEVRASLESEIGSLAPEHFLKVLGGHFAILPPATSEGGLPDPNRHTRRLFYAQDVLWTLQLDDTPVYVIRPEGPFAEAAYATLRDFMIYQIEVGKKYRSSGFKNLARVSLAGRISGTVRLSDGVEVPVVVPELRSMYVWTIDRFMEELSEARNAEEAGEPERSDIILFLERIYFVLRNAGRTPGERAVNFSATNALLISQIFKKAYKEHLSLLSIDTVKSSFCPPGADCRDVVFVFFNPMKQLEEAKTLFRFTVNVNEEVPVLTGPVRSWKE